MTEKITSKICFSLSRIGGTPVMFLPLCFYFTLFMMTLFPGNLSLRKKWHCEFRDCILLPQAFQSKEKTSFPNLPAKFLGKSSIASILNLVPRYWTITIARRILLLMASVPRGLSVEGSRLLKANQVCCDQKGRDGCRADKCILWKDHHTSLSCIYTHPCTHMHTHPCATLNAINIITNSLCMLRKNIRTPIGKWKVGKD